MSGNEISLTLEKRRVVRKGLNKLRTDGFIPAVVHDPGNDSVNVVGKYLDIVKVYESAGKTHPVNLTVGDQDFLTMIKQVDFDPKKHQLRHVVFGAIKKDQKVKAEVPIEMVLGEDDEQTPAEQEGLVINWVIDELEIEAIPSNLVDKLEVDGSKLTEVGDKLHISNVVVPEGVEIVRAEDDDEDKTIVTVDAPREEEPEPEVETEEGEEGEEGEESEESAEGEEGDTSGEGGSDSEKDNSDDKEKPYDKQ